MTIQSPETVDEAGQLAQLLFRIFIYVSDTDKDITPYEVHRFNRLLEDTRWTTSVELRRALERLRGDYASLWAAYETKAFAFDLATISQQLESAWFSKSTNIVELRHSLRDFVQKTGQTASPALARLGLAGAAVSKAKARSDIEGLLSEGAPVAPRPQEASPSPRGPSVLAAPIGGAADRLAALWPAATGTMDAGSSWKGGRTRMRCVNVTAETADVITYSFVAASACLFTYRPGQFLVVEANIDGQTVRRSYTISSSPSRPHTLSITVKRVPGGAMSNWLYDSMTEGVEIDMNGPHGVFSCFQHPNDKLLFISGGSGITPMMSMLRWLSDTSSRADIVFINNVRSPADIVFESELKMISARLGSRMRLAIVPGLLPSGHGWNGLTGALNDNMLQTFAPDFLQREVFVCGPPGYMDMVRNMLQQMDFPLQHHHQESFGAAPAAIQRDLAAAAVKKGPAPLHAVPVSPAPIAAAVASGMAAGDAAPLRPPAAVAAPKPPPPAPKVTPPPRPRPMTAQAPRDTAPASPPVVVLELSGRSLSGAPNEVILETAERHGVVLPNSCRSGVCGTCKVRKSRGTVDMAGQQALSDADIEDGYVLACIGRARGTVVLEA
jgi:ferredoxin-NADP reductase/ferredoxin